MFIRTGKELYKAESIEIEKSKYGDYYWFNNVTLNGKPIRGIIHGFKEDFIYNEQTDTYTHYLTFKQSA